MNRCRALLTIAVILLFSTAHAVQKPQFDSEHLTPNGRVAYRELVSAEIFRVGGVGYSGETSEAELALYDLLEEQDAVEALKGLVSDGSYEGGLYGLLGLSVTNVGAFNRAVEVYKARKEPPERRLQSFAGLDVPKGQVTTQSGCIVGADGWLKVVSNIQSGRYDGVLRKDKR